MEFIDLILAFFTGSYNQFYYHYKGLVIHMKNKKEPLSNHQRIIKKYKHMFCGYYRRSHPFSPMVFGLEIGSGWDHGFETMLECLSKIDTKKCVQFDQVKEKFGGARYYFHLSRNDLIGRLLIPLLWKKVLVGLPWIKKIIEKICLIDDKEYYHRIETIVDAFELLAGHTCEICGRWGTIKNKGSWLKALCTDCAKKEGYEEFDEKDIP